MINIKLHIIKRMKRGQEKQLLFRVSACFTKSRIRGYPCTSLLTLQNEASLNNYLEVGIKGKSIRVALLAN